MTVPLGHRLMGILPERARIVVDPLEARGIVLLGSEVKAMFAGAPDLPRAVHAGLPPAAQGEPLLPGPVLAAVGFPQTLVAALLIDGFELHPYEYREEVVDEGLLQPRFGFNLHDQDVGTRVGDHASPVVGHGDAQLRRAQRGGRGRVGAELAIHLLDVRRDGMDGNAQPNRRLGVGVAGRDQSQNVDLARREARLLACHA